MALQCRGSRIPSWLRLALTGWSFSWELKAGRRLGSEGSGVITLVIRSRLVRTTVGSFRAEQGSWVMVALYVTQTKAGRSEFEACLGHLVSKKPGVTLE